MPETLQLGYRTGKFAGVFNASPEYTALAPLEKIDVVSRSASYSPDGRFFAWSSPECVTIADSFTGVVVTKIPRTQALEIDFSPNGTYISMYQNWTRDADGNPSKNISIWKVEDGLSGDAKQVLSEFHQSTPDCWKFQFTADESICARLVNNGVCFFRSPDFRTTWKKAQADGVGSFSLAPATSALAVFTPMKKGEPGWVKVYRNLTFDKPVSQRSLFKGDRINLEWNSTGTCLLVLATTDVDTTNKSYYGEHHLYVLHAQLDLTATVTLDKTGPIHDVQWSPSAKSFAVVYGFMPASVTIFNLRAEVSHKFVDPGSRNTILFSPHGKFLLVAGFGNLSGQMDIYDLERDYEKVSTIDGNIATFCKWAPDGQHILTATTSPRMTVDNRIRIWHVSGNVMYNQDIDDLLAVQWRPRDTKLFPLGDWKKAPTAHSSANAYLATVRKPVKTGAYRPPGAPAPGVADNGTRTRYVPGAEPVVPVDDSKNSKIKRRREKKVPRGGEPTDETGAPQLQIDGKPIPTGPTRAGRTGRTGRSNERNDQDSRRGGNQSSSRHPSARPPVNKRTDVLLNKRAEESRLAKVAAVDRVTNAMAGVGGVSLGVSEAVVESTPLYVNEANTPNRRVRTLLKKLREIESLRMRQAGGELLEATQLSKIDSEVAFRVELNSMGFDEGMDIGV